MIKIIALPLLLIACSVNATEKTHALGIGLQYAGIVGYQLSFTNETHRFRGALGLIGVSVGYDYLLTNNWSLGATYTQTIRSVYSINFNYYLNNPNEGMRFSLDLAHMPDENSNSSGFLATNGSKSAVFLSAGYAF